ncbi:MAG: response regulator transcription factor [Coriobacteriia bacterium]|nr:response regulator transcription factor [Coriobacteriia bacterium]
MGDIRVLIADDHELVRLALRNLLEAEGYIRVVGEAADGEEALRLARELDPDVLLLDLRMPKMSGVEVCREMGGSGSTTRIVVLTSYDDDEELFAVLSTGVAGYVMKDTRPDGILQAVRAVVEGQTVLDPTVAKRVIDGQPPHHAPQPIEGLSEREVDVLRLMAKGCNNRQIGQTLWIAEATVKSHVSHILRKLDVTDRTQAVLAAVRSGLVDVSEQGG